MGKKKGAVRVKQVGPKMLPAMPNPMEALQIPPEEMIQLPPEPDRNYQIVWPISETFSLNTDGFQVIYPSYLDSEKTVAQGRRLARDKAVERPTVSDLSLALQQLRVRHVLQPYKGYSRDPVTLWDNPGRVLVDLTDYKKKELLGKLAERIPELEPRHVRLAAEAQERAKEQAARQQALEAAAASKPKKTVVVGSKKKGKKGKKK